jgi:hypothetical protein
MFNFPAKQTTPDQDQLSVEPEKDGSQQYVRRSRLGRDINLPSTRRTRGKADYSSYRQSILTLDCVKPCPQALQWHVFIQGQTRLCNSSESASTS